MEEKIEIIEHFPLNENRYDKEEEILLSGKFAGVCYDKEGFNHLVDEPIERTRKRVDMTLNNGHHSVYGHSYITLNLQNIPKILAMVLNNENEYTTSEKSARYTPLVRKENSYISEDEEILYNKWLNIFEIKIKEKYGYIYNDSKIKKLAQENARYLISVFMPTQMIYTTSFRQINYIASWMLHYRDNVNLHDEFEVKLAGSMHHFVSELNRLNLLEYGLLQNEKERKISLFSDDVDKVDEHFGYAYSTTYKASYACLAQEQRHRTLDYQMKRLDKKEFFVPPIILDDETLTNEWLDDMKVVSKYNPQGELVLISETGKYDNFILKCKERLCSAAQLEIMLNTRETLLKYRDALKESNHYLATDIEKYTKGARCTFPDFTCTEDCKFKEGKTLVRKI